MLRRLSKLFTTPERTAGKLCQLKVVKMLRFAFFNHAHASSIFSAKEIFKSVKMIFYEAAITLVNIKSFSILFNEYIY